ncbi:MULTISPECIES: roadblock/LC7 domain-containing protein [Thermomonospora]|uniref:Putative regulator of Ras-like GTPase activity (Roadblock/LC7/MglB family) n=1 Tax=Thermomonospora cellulosilytica TaxID=1411118 RepID=A0A7W3N3R8_9ACTN|nr:MULTISPECIES: roadblock/LC7 domain-containing protein [Thermomonospora]MBA9006892.1 putative regulator of Ras-like GTPase activity (Roadblock/LC7/MglB family) [Thermomonospora cellulosilytica]
MTDVPMNAAMADPTENRLGWMLDEALRMPEARHAILLSADGLLMAHSQRISRDEAERQAAGMSGLQSLARATAEFCGDDPDTTWRQTVTEFDDGYVFLVAAGEGAYLAVSASPQVDMEAVSFRLQELVQRLGKELSTPPRRTLA